MTKHRRHNLLLALAFAGGALVSAAAAAAEAGSGNTTLGLTWASVAAVLFLSWLLPLTAGPALRERASQRDRQRLMRLLRTVNGKMLEDFIVPGTCNGLVRIDYAVLTATGLLCLRRVQASGALRGGEHDAQWHARGKRGDYRFLNPLIQVSGHARALQALLPDMPVTTAVVVTGQAYFSGGPPPGVVDLPGLRELLGKNIREREIGGHLLVDWRVLEKAARTDTATRRDFAAQLGFG